MSDGHSSTASYGNHRDEKMTRSFQTTTTGKWILMGEHAVLRGVPALVFPLESLKLNFEYIPGNPSGDLQLDLSGPYGAELDLLFWGVLEKSCAMTGVRRNQLEGNVRIRNEIPVGAGLGASAAFCVAFARWFSFEGFVLESEVAKFAQSLEDLFHGESSGLDIAVVAGGQPLRYQRGGQSLQFTPMWTPKIYLSYSGQRGVTRECVAKVKELLRSDPVEGEKWDHEMRMAVETAEASLLTNMAVGEPMFLASMEKAASCFEAWGLFEGQPEKRAQALLAKGALAVKPTGSGGGGYLLSFWKEAPPAEMLLSGELIPGFTHDGLSE